MFNSNRSTEESSKSPKKNLDGLDDRSPRSSEGSPILHYLFANLGYLFLKVPLLWKSETDDVICFQQLTRKKCFSLKTYRQKHDYLFPDRV